MLKLLGSACVMAAGGLMWYRVVSEERRRTKVLREIAAALELMGDEIRLNRTPMPRLLLKAGSERGQEAMEFFAAVRMGSLEHGLAEAWRGAAEKLPFSVQERQTVAEAGTSLQGDEEQACRGLSAAAEALRKVLEQRRETAVETEKRCTALCLSSAALIIILLV